MELLLSGLVGAYLTISLHLSGHYQALWQDWALIWCGLSGTVLLFGSLSFTLTSMVLS